MHTAYLEPVLDNFAGPLGTPSQSLLDTAQERLDSMYYMAFKYDPYYRLCVCGGRTQSPQYPKPQTLNSEP